MTDTGWFATDNSFNLKNAVTAIRTGSASNPANWPEIAVETGVVGTVEEYYEYLHEATITATEEELAEKAHASDQQLIHAIRGYDTLAETSNELVEVAEEWAGNHYGETQHGREYIDELATRTPTDPIETRIIGLAAAIQSLEAERTALMNFIDETTPQIAPNLSMLAGPVLTARLISITGSLKSLARKPSGTIQVLGAESALFAHLKGHAPSPKHGVIYTHEAIHDAAPGKQGKAARILAGKLAIAARIDYYSGEPNPSLATELERRLETTKSS